MKRPQGRPRRVFAPRMEFTEQAYHILEAAATTLLHRKRLLKQGFITVEDLVSHCWAKTFFYMRTTAEMEETMFMHAYYEMGRYLREHGPRRYQPLEGDDELDIPPLDVVSLRALDDPSVAATAVDEWLHLSEDQRRIVFDTVYSGAKLSRAQRRLLERVEMLERLATHRFTRRDRRIIYQCLVRGRTVRQVAGELGISRERVRQILRAVRSGRRGRPRH